MSTVINLPPKTNCHACGTPLRRAPRAEVNMDLQSKEYREIAELAAQGDISAEPKEKLSDWRKDIFEPGSWLLKCDKCGARVLWSRDEG